MFEGSVTAIIVAAGTGTRFGLNLPKQFAPLGGKTVLSHSYRALAAHPAIGQIVVVIGAGQEQAARQALMPLTQSPLLVQGGETRRDSVFAALQFIDSQQHTDKVLIHDAARPFIPAGVIDRLLEALEARKGAIPTLPVADTLAKAVGGELGQAVERDGLHRVQTPQAFHFETILRAHQTVTDNAMMTDDAGLLRALDIPVALVQGDAMLEKLTYPADFDRAEMALAVNRIPRTGIGYDVHKLVEGKPLWLCGIQISHSHGLSGHSDADVAIHALVDAILGALAEGDIGTHFPPSDPQWKGAPSRKFLTFARDRVIARGGTIAHTDITIICEAPKIGPHKNAMRSKISELLDIPLDRVSVKATTTERLGFTGRREGIAAQAVVTILTPVL